MSTRQNSRLPWRLMNKRSLSFCSPREAVMRYLGRISGYGALQCNGEHIARASYGFDGFVTKPLAVTCCGEIQLSAAILKDVFGRRDVQLLTDEGTAFGERCCPRGRHGRAVSHTTELAQLTTGPMLGR